MNTDAIIRPISMPNSFTQIKGALAPPASLKRSKTKPAGFVVALAHEVRNPVCNINLALEMMNSTSLTGEQRQYTGIISRGTNKINDLINSLLLYEQTDDPKSDLYSLNHLLDEVLAMANDRITLKRIRVSREYAGTDLSVRVDMEKIKMALSNIIINAIDAMSPEKGELRLITKSLGDRAIIEVHDNGIGISKEDLKKIFQPFFTSKPGGMGLGLSATWDIIRENNATVDVQSKEGVGTCFILSFKKS